VVDGDPLADISILQDRRKLAQGERTANVVVIGQRDDVEPGALRGVENLSDRRETVAEVAVELKISAPPFDPHAGSNTVHCSGCSLM